MGITNLEVLFEEGGSMSETTPSPGGAPQPGDDPQKDESPSPALPVDNPDLPVEGDPDEPEEEPVPDDDFDDPHGNDSMDNEEEAEEPNDLSGIEKEFDDEEDKPGE